jgi:2'-5' RNA ligase
MSLRLFIAIEPPDSVQRKLAAMQSELKRHGSGDVKWVAPEGIHLTLQFLGAVLEERVKGIETAIAEAAAGSRPLLLEVKGAGGFPNARHPRVIWAGVSGDLQPLAALVADLGHRLAPLGFPPEDRPFSPHLTLGRARDSRGASGFAGGLAKLSSEEGASWRASEVCLVRSVLSPGGAQYEVMSRAAMGMRQSAQDL